jgi:hypothetical protein
MPDEGFFAEGQPKIGMTREFKGFRTEYLRRRKPGGFVLKRLKATMDDNTADIETIPSEFAEDIR